MIVYYERGDAVHGSPWGIDGRPVWPGPCGRPRAGRRSHSPRTGSLARAIRRTDRRGDVGTHFWPNPLSSRSGSDLPAYPRE
ncbi:hypothetical protein AORI_6202 [Amycolatopsis keratiniphila]|uniref:Uncharacterized protein n=1 Tax=Amycolatopsis keratiniphila TaxID=129921 RepID=R4T1S2_9PSEU|nr:hypothetical protein AORI_6202 [Amycolatopsis keratiniphila]